MDDITKQELFRELGTIKAKLDSNDSNNKAQWEKLDKIDDRLRKQEIKAGGIAATVSGIVAVGMHYVTKTLSGT